MFFAYWFRGPARLFAIVGLVGIAALSACTVPKPPPPPAPVAAPAPVAGHPLDHDQAEFLRLPNLTPGATPVRVGVILPLTSGTPATRALAQSMLKAAELALFDAGNRDIVLITADEGAGPQDAAASAAKLLAQGAEVIVGPLFGASVAAVAPLARDRGVPVLAFSTEKSVAGNGVYLLSFLPQNEVARIVSYAAAKGHSQFAALVPQTAYGELAAQAFEDSVKNVHAANDGVERFAPNSAQVMEPSARIAKTSADAILIAQGGAVLKAIAPSLAFSGMDKTHVKLLGTGLWDDPALAREDTLLGGWFAAADPNAEAQFDAKYRAAFGAPPAQLAPLAYDALSLVALLANGTPYHRFTAAALADPNGFAGVNGIFRFAADDTSERGLAVLEMAPGGPVVVDPAPKTFLRPGS